ncbi:hypothetical protein [Haloarchaeobius sp. DFWS5]|uniref:hypothetical protein n=1 Tax=Haloarchaeobius sp. DFWS5 TaxID=3446114 RepID=UPI003EBDEAAB
MKRRALLSTVALGLGGCLASDDPGSSSSTSSTTHSQTTSDGTTPAQSTTTGTGTADPPEVGVPVDQTDCPAAAGDDARVVCWPVMADEPLVLSASKETVSHPTDEVEFTLHNETDASFATNFYGWGLEKRVDERWYHVTPWTVPEPLMYVPSGESHTWTVSLGDGDVTTRRTQKGQESVSLAGLGGGEYAFTNSGWFEGTDYEETSVGLAAQFTIDGPAIELRPSSRVTGSTRDGSVVTVERSHPDNYQGRLAEYRVRRVDSAPDPRQFITEQVLRFEYLRDTLSAFESGVDTVRLVEQNGTHPAFGVHDAEYVRYEGQTYEITANELESETETATEDA